MRISIAARELAAAQSRAEKAWSNLEKRRARKLQEVTEIERQLERMHPLMRSLFRACRLATKAMGPKGWVRSTPKAFAQPTFRTRR